MLLQGPDLCNNLTGVLLRFRQEEVAVAADIRNMFHQVFVEEQDRSVLRFLWFPNHDMTQTTGLPNERVALWLDVFAKLCIVCTS